MAGRPGWLVDLDDGPVPYADAWSWQRALVAARQAGLIPDLLMLLEHRSVVTLGRSGDRGHLRVSREVLSVRGIEVYQIERGGGATYHGPGQLVGYPILDLRALGGDIARYMRSLEASIIATLEAFGIHGGREPGYPGVWVGGAKIGAIGVAVKRGVTMHGLALNVTTDLSPFELINPCGLDRPVTSMAVALGRPVDLAQVRRVFAERFGAAVGIGLERVSLAQALRAVPRLANAG